MLDILDDYLSGATSPEVVESVRQAHMLFDAYGMDTYEQGFEEILMTADNLDSHAGVDLTVQLTRSLQYKVLREHGITLNPDLFISRLNLYLDAILRTQNFGNPAALFSVLSLEHDPVEIAAEMFALVMGLGPEELLPDIEQVDPALLTLIVTRLDEHHVADTPEVVAQKNGRIKAYNNFVQLLEIRQLKVAYLLENGIDVAHPVLVYLNLLGKDFDEMEPKAIAQELVAMCLISSDAHDNPREVINTKLEWFVSDLDKITAVSLIVNDILLKVAQHG